MAGLARPPRSRWTSFVADPTEPRPRVLFEDGNPAHGRSRHAAVAVGEASRQLDAAEQAFEGLYGAPGED